VALHPSIFVDSGSETKETTTIKEGKEVVGLTRDGRCLVIELMMSSISLGSKGETLSVAVLHDITGAWLHLHSIIPPICTSPSFLRHTDALPLVCVAGNYCADLKHLAEMNALIFDSARSPMVVSNANGEILQVNQSVTEVFGFERVSAWDQATLSRGSDK